MRKRLLVISITIEIIVIFLIGLHIYKNTRSSANLSIHPIKREDLLFSPTKDLKYFYELPLTVKNKVPDPFGATYTINKDDLNERYNYPVKKEQDVFRIITVGDSWTQGLYVDTKDNWTEILEDKLDSLECKKMNKFEVINLGVEGYDTQYEVERYKKRGVKYSPDLVLWLVVDLKRYNEKLMPLIDYYYQKSLLEKKADKSAVTPEFSDFQDGYFFWKSAWNEVNKEINYDNMLKIQKKSFDDFDSLYKGRLVYIGAPDLESKENEFLKGLAKSKDKYLLPNLSNIERFKVDAHPDKKGHEEIADEVLNYLVSNNIIPCDK